MQSTFWSTWPDTPPATACLAFARKPAHCPVQVSYLGYPDTTGLTTIDYRLTDALADPPDLTDPHHSEILYRLPRTNWCFQEPPESSPVKPPPMSRLGCVTFGSFNNFAKITGPMLQTWAKILREIPGSRLFLKAAALAAPGLQGPRSRDIDGVQGIDAGRLTLPRPDGRLCGAIWRCTAEIDIALDTFPYHGTTTTCEALWMGVPVITLAGQSHVSRVGVSLLGNVGLAELVAGGTDEYIRLAVALARDRERLTGLRGGLRGTNAKVAADGCARLLRGPSRRRIGKMWRNRWCV